VDGNTAALAETPVAAAARTGEVVSVRQCVHRGEQLELAVKVECCNGRRTRNASVFICDARHRCLPSYRPKNAALESWKERKPESDLYALCAGCSMFEPVAQDASACEQTGGRDYRAG